MLELQTCRNVDVYFRKRYVRVFHVDVYSVAAHEAQYRVPGPKCVQNCYEITVVIYKYPCSW